MKNIKEKFNNMREMFKKAIFEFPITIITILVATILIGITIETDLISDTSLSNIMFGAVIFALGDFLLEILIKKEYKKRRIIFYIISAIISVVSIYIVNKCSEQLAEIATRIILSYMAIAFLLAIYFNYKKSKLPFEKYVTCIFGNIFKVSIIYGLLAIGIAMITAIFILLILEGSDNNYFIIVRMEIFLFGIYYLPKIIYSFYNVQNEISKFGKVIIKYVLDILVMIAFAIIYLYIAKIIILRNIPSNAIFRITAGLFAIGLPIWTMTSCLDEDKKIDKINRKLPILFTPFILLQIYSIGTRISNYGITELRYLCIMVIIFEIIYTVIYLKDKKKVGYVLIVLSAIIIISFVLPYINMINISRLSQYNNLKIYKEKAEYTDKEKTKISGAYYYLKRTDEGERLINESLSQSDIKKIASFDTSEYNKNVIDTEYVYANYNAYEINIEGYKKIYRVTTKYSNAKNNNQNIDNIFKKVELCTNEYSKSNKIIVLDLTNIFKACIANKDDVDSYIKNNYQYYINENKKLIIENISCSYSDSTKLINDYGLSGYILEK